MAFAIFPKFSKLKLEEKKEYESFISKWPALSDTAFSTLHIWWNLEDQLKVSNLNGNLVINYVLPFDQDSSGLGLVGEHDIDGSMQRIFDYQKHGGKKQEIVHVPEFVVRKIKQKQKYPIQEEADYHEYIISSTEHATLEASKHAYTRKKVRRFRREVEGKKLEVKPLDLSDRNNQTLILRNLTKWQAKFAGKNDPYRTEDLALQITISKAQKLGTQNLCLYIDRKIHGIVLYHASHDKKYYILNHLKVDYSVPYMFDFLTNQVAVLAAQKGIKFLNMEMDLGIEGLKKHKVALRPIAMLKKFTITPDGMPGESVDRSK